MFKRIVVGLDGSEGSQQALSAAVELARGDGAMLVLAHVEERIIGKGGGPLHADEQEVQAAIHRQAEELSSQRLETEVQMADAGLGGPAHELEEIAEAHGADLIVVGDRGPLPRRGFAGRQCDAEIAAHCPPAGASGPQPRLRLSRA